MLTTKDFCEEITRKVVYNSEVQNVSVKLACMIGAGYGSNVYGEEIKNKLMRALLGEDYCDSFALNIFQQYYDDNKEFYDL